MFILGFWGFGGVHIEALWDASDPVGETRWLETLDKSGGIAIRYTGAAPFGTPDAARILEQQAAFPRMIGIRDILSFHPITPERSFTQHGGKAYDPAWRADIARLSGLGLALELMMYPYQLDAVIDVARTFPDLRLVINHCVSPIDRDEAGMQRWRDAVKALGREPNILLKVSNAMGYDPDPTYESVRPVVMHCIESFGAERSILATDWPVAGLKIGFDEIYDMLRRMVADMTEAEQRALFYDNAAKLYRIDGAP